MKDCCENCKLYFPLVKFDYSHGGCAHSDMDGYICMAFATPESREPPVAIWMVGEDPKRGMCECYKPKELKPCDKCGKIPKLERGYIGIEEVWWVEPCGCYVRGFNYPDRDGAIKAWNAQVGND